MQIVGDHNRLNGKKIFEVCNALHERVPRLVVFQVADVVAQESVALFAKAKSVLEMGAAGENRLDEGHRDGDWARRMAPRAADERFLFADQRYMTQFA